MREDTLAVGLGNGLAASLAGITIWKKDPVADIRVLQDASNLALVIKDGKKIKLADDGSEDALLLKFQQAV